MHNDHVRGYTDTTYGDAFADVYDDWYRTLTDLPSFTAMAYGLALPGLPVLELGVGTGRLAVALATAGLDVVGIDISEAMAARVPAAGPGTIQVVIGDMVEDLPPGPYGLAVCGFNTLFNLRSEERQTQCFEQVAERLAPGASLLIEASVPGDTPADAVEVRSLAVDEVVLSISRSLPEQQVAEGHFVTITQDGGVRLRPWAIRWATAAQLDEMASLAGLELIGRYADYRRSPLTDDAPRHVSIYQARDTA